MPFGVSWTLSQLTQAADLDLRYVNLEPSMLRSHVLSSCVYLVLGHLDRMQAYRFGQPRLILAMASGPGVAVVVSVNCFLAKFCSAFGRYLTLDGS